MLWFIYLKNIVRFKIGNVCPINNIKYYFQNVDLNSFTTLVTQTMNTIKVILFIFLFSVLNINSQNQLPIENGILESVVANNFVQWTNQANNGANANFSIETNNLIPGSSKALKSEILALGDKNYDASTKSDYGFEIVQGKNYTVSFYAKIEGASSRQLKIVFNSEVANSYQGQDIWITDSWQKYSHTFTATVNSTSNKLRFWYLQAGVTYYLDEVSVVPGNFASIAPTIEFQTIDGFGAGIKRRTEHLYALDDSIREQVEAYCFQDLEVNMIRFFVYHDLEPENDNNNPYDLDASKLDWTRYNSNPNNSRTRFIGEALNNAFNLSTNGFDHVIGNCNSAPPWLKTNGQHNNGGTLISGGENEYSEFLIAFLNGMKSNYNLDVTAISPTNEPDFEVSYESMNTTPSELNSIIKNLNTRLDNASLSDIKIISPENYRVYDANNSSRSATNYINTMFADPLVKSAIDIVATHTYADPNHNTSWGALKTAADNKPVWVTESASLKSKDISMTDAANYIKWMLRGFNEGGMTAYMMHLFYEEEDTENGYSSLVAWKPNGEIILPKRYHSFKHFTNLIKIGYKVIKTEVSKNETMVGAFKSPDGKKIVLHVFNEGTTEDISIDIPIGTVGIDHYITSDSNDENFKLVNDISFTEGDRYTNINTPAMSLHSIIYDIDLSVLNIDSESDDTNTNEYSIFPNPTNDIISIHFSEEINHEIRIHQMDGKEVYKTNSDQNLDLNVKFLSAGIYLIKILTEEKGNVLTKKFIKR